MKLDSDHVLCGVRMLNKQVFLRKAWCVGAWVRRVKII